MELSWLEDFLTLSITGNFSKAAETRNVSQPAFSRRIRNLEYWVGTPLVDRGVYPIALTPAGEAFRKQAEETVQTLQYAREEAKGLVPRSGPLVAFTGLHTMAINFFPKWIAQVQEGIGEIQIRMVADNLSGCVEAIMSGSSDLMLCYAHPSVPSALDINLFPSIELSVDRILPVSAAREDGAPKYDLRRDADIPYLWYPPECFMGRIINPIVSGSGLGSRLKFHYENSMTEALKAVAVGGGGLAWLPEISIRNELKWGALKLAGDESHAKTVSIRLYRSIERSRPEVERLWAFASSSVKPAAE